MSLFNSIFQRGRNRSSWKARRPVRKARRGALPAVEFLEDRCVPSANFNLTELANYQRSTLTGGSGNPQTVDYTAAGGVTFDNTYDATTLADGSHFVSLGALLLNQVITNGSGNQFPTGDGTLSGQGTTHLVKIVALEGTTHVSGSTVTVTFDHGVTMLFQTSEAFVGNDLSTWGFTGTPSAMNGGLPLDVKVLKPAEAILTGDPNAYNSQAAGQGPGSVNVVSSPITLGQSVSGTALFLDAGTDIWANRTTTGLPAGAQFSSGELADFSDVFQNSSNSNFDITTNANNLTIANNIFTAFGALDPGLKANGGQFASGFNNGLASGYIPNLVQGVGTATGDFPSQVTSTIAPTIEVETVPDVHITITPLTPTNVVNNAETFTITVTAFPGGTTGTPTFALPTVTFPVTGAPGTVGPVTLVSGPTLQPDGSWVTTYTETINNPTAGAFNVQASDTVTFGDGTIITRTTGDGNPGDSQSAVKTYEDEIITITPNGTDVVNHNHTFTATVFIDTGDGNGFHHVGAGTVVIMTLTNSNGATASPAGPFTLTTNSNGQVSQTFTSATAGVVTGSASTTLDLGTGGSITRTTGDNYVVPGSNPPIGDGANATKVFEDLVISINPPIATNPVGASHTFTIEVDINKGDGNGFVADPNATVVVTLTPSGGAAVVQIAPTNGTVSSGVVTYTLTTDSNGQTTVTFTSNTAGTVTGHATTTLDLSGLTPPGGTLTRSTGDGYVVPGSSPPIGDSPDAVKIFVPPANVTVVKTIETKNADGTFTDQPSPFTINLGDTAYFKITISNTGGLDATGVKLTDPLDRDPEGNGTGILTWQIVTQTPSSPAAGLGDQSGTSSTVLLTWDIGTLAAGATDTIIVSTDTTPLLTLHGTDIGAPLPTNLFQLDSDAQSTTNPSSLFANAPDDWDNVLGFSNPPPPPPPPPPPKPPPRGMTTTTTSKPISSSTGWTRASSPRVARRTSTTRISGCGPPAASWTRTTCSTPSPPSTRCPAPPLA
jgi:hypothetical protein